MELPAGSGSLPSARRAYLYLGTLVAAYIGVYLCRKNLSVAVPLLQRDWGLSKEAIGTVASVSTLAYACGKIGFGPWVDRLGGRVALLGSMTLVVLFTAATAFAPSLLLLTVLYSANRLAGSACWGSMVKLAPGWFSPRRLAFALGLLSLSYVFGGALASGFAGLVARWSGEDWRWVLGGPSLVLLALAFGSAQVLPGSARSAGSPAVDGTGPRRRGWAESLALLKDRQLHVLCALSFTLTFLRETFNFWTVDFFLQGAGEGLSNSAAAFLSMPFDLCGAAGILGLGWCYGRLSHRARRRLLFGVLLLLSAVLLWLPALRQAGVAKAAAAVGLIGFLVYGPYSLLAGVLAVELRGPESAATVSGWVDGSGYFAGVLSGTFFGWLVGHAGYPVGFRFLAGLTLVAALLCLALAPSYRQEEARESAGRAERPEPSTPLPTLANASKPECATP